MNAVSNELSMGLVENKTSLVRSVLLTKTELKEKFSEPQIGLKDGPGYVPSNIPTGRRLTALVKNVSFLVFDIDNKEQAISEGEIISIVESYNYEGILHSTHSHQVDAPRFRLILFVSVPIAAMSYQDILYRVAEQLGITTSMDSACTDAARLFYFPRCPEERLGDYVYHYFDGSPVDVDSCLKNIDIASNLLPVTAVFQRRNNEHDWAETKENIAKVKDFLSCCPADCDYQIWRDISWAVCWLNWSCGEVILREWSMQSASHWSSGNASQTEMDFSTLIDSYDSNRDKPLSIGTLIAHAKKGGWKPESPFEVIASRKVDAFEVDFEPRFKIYDRSALNQLPPMEWLVDGIVPSQGVAAIYGESGCGKTFLALDLAASISQGKSNWFGFDIEQRDVVYMALEGEGGIANRLEAWELENGQEASKLNTLLGNFNLNSKNDVDTYLQLIDGVVGKGAVTFIDTLSQASPGTEENNSKDIGILLNAAKQIAAQTEGVVIIIHHSGKDTSKGLRGHSSMNAAMDLCIEVKKDLLGHHWHTRKVKDGDGDIARSFTLAKQELNGTSLKKKVSSCAVKEIDAQRIVKPPTGKNQRPIYEAVKAMLENQNSPSTKEVLEVAKNALPHCNKSRRHTRAKETLKELVEKGYFNMSDNGSYSLSET